jgi:hypothetical protein
VLALAAAVAASATALAVVLSKRLFQPNREAS